MLSANSLGGLALMLVSIAALTCVLVFRKRGEVDKPPRLPHEPYLVQLRRESVPVKRKGEVVSHKTSYSGVLSVGVGSETPQEFRVVFDTGSGHVVFPSKSCKSESCLLHRQYDVSESPSATPINVDGTTVPEGELCDQVKIGFGTGSVVGEFVRDTVCLGSAAAGGAQWRDTICQEIQIVTAVEMSTTPFKNFGFDGILGLGLKSLALSPDFSFFNLLSQGEKLGAPHFGVFLTDGDSGQSSEIAIGGHNPARLLQPLSWSPVAKPELGYWQVEITAIRVDGVELDMCKDGSCRGVMDTGTSHLGIPAPHDKSLAQLLTRDALDLDDCREVNAPVLEIEVQGFNITLDPENYMRQLPLRAGVNVGSSKGVVLPSQASSTTTLPPTVLRDDGSEVDRYCRPRLMPVNLPAPVGPNLFILGEPVLQRYYTVFDWKGPSIGFGLSSNAKNSKIGKKYIYSDDGVIFFQVTVTVRRKNPELLALA
jgi:saccharopepsin